VLHHREVVRAVILAGTNSSNLLEPLDHKGVLFVLLCNNALGVPPDFKNIPTELVKRDSCHSSTEKTLNAWQTVEA
jgi:hypothetical protein